VGEVVQGIAGSRQELIVDLHTIEKALTGSRTVYKTLADKCVKDVNHRKNFKNDLKKITFHFYKNFYYPILQTNEHRDGKRRDQLDTKSLLSSQLPYLSTSSN